MGSDLSGYAGLPWNQSEISFPCYKCGKSFTQKANLQRHLKFIHTGNKPYVCDICHKAFNRKGNMEVHKLTHMQ